MWGRGPIGSNGACLFHSLQGFSHSLRYPHSSESFWCSFPSGGFVYVLGPCGSLQWTLLSGWEFLLLQPQPPQVFSISGLRLYFPTLGPWVAPSVSIPSCSSRFICMWMLDHLVWNPKSTTLPGPPATALLWVLSTQLPVSTPPTGLNECFFFTSLVVGCPYSSIFCQFWLFFVFKFVVVLLVVQGGTVCVYLHLHLGWKSIFLFKNILKNDWSKQ